MGRLSLFSATSWQARSKLLRKHFWTLGKQQKVSKPPKERTTQMATMVSIFKARAVFPPVESLPRSYFLGHHAAGLSKMNTLLSQIDLIVECRDYRVPLTSRNPLFEQSLAGRERIIIYTKRDLGSNNKPADKEVSFVSLWPPARLLLTWFAERKHHSQMAQTLRGPLLRPQRQEGHSQSPSLRSSLLREQHVLDRFAHHGRWHAQCWKIFAAQRSAKRRSRKGESGTHRRSARCHAQDFNKRQDHRQHRRWRGRILARYSWCLYTLRPRCRSHAEACPVRQCQRHHYPTCHSCRLSPLSCQPDRSHPLQGILSAYERHHRTAQCHCT